MIVREVETSVLRTCLNNNIYNTIFSTFEWIEFLKKNQKATPLVLELKESDDSQISGYFVGLITKIACVRILGSPFDGWLTPDMGFIRIKEFNINEALKAVAKYAFHKKGCWYIQICDKNINHYELDKSIKYTLGKILHLDISKSQNEILNNFKKNGRRDIRAFYRKGARVEKVLFDKKFADVYYEQLIDVFAKQSLKPFYDKEKIYDLADAFKDKQDCVLALMALNEEDKCIATVLSFGLGDWAYYLGAASLRQYQKLLPNEGLFWEFVKYWKERGITNLDLVGYREYKMKYNPELVSVPVIYFERIPGILWVKKNARNVIMRLRKIKAVLKQ